MRLGLLALLLLLLVSQPVLADYLVVSRPATLKVQPDKDAVVLGHLQKGDSLRLLEEVQQEGYYHAQPYTGGHAGWVYRTLVRRYHDEPEEMPPSEASPAASNGAVDVSAFLLPGCPLEGDAQQEHMRKLNRLKNRTRAPVEFNPSISLEAILAPGPDQDRWNNHEGAEVLGYVLAVKPGGVETVNCHAQTILDRDTHIELVLDAEHDSKTDRLIVEVTPAWRKYMTTQGRDWSSAALKDSLIGKHVRVQGWMFFDAQHQSNAFNTEPDAESENIWRATAWEIHPVTNLEVVEEP